MATRWIDFTALKHQVSVKDVLARYGLMTGLQEKKPGRLVGPCPIHGGKNGTSFNVHTEKNVFHCFSECGGGNVLDLVMKIEKCSIREAGEKLADWFDLKFERTRRPGNLKPPKAVAPRAATTPSPPPRQTDNSGPNPALERALKDLNPDRRSRSRALLEDVRRSADAEGGAGRSGSDADRAHDGSGGRAGPWKRAALDDPEASQGMGRGPRLPGGSRTKRPRRRRARRCRPRA